jgi:hypothetical protein
MSRNYLAESLTSIIEANMSSTYSKQVLEAVITNNDLNDLGKMIPQCLCTSFLFGNSKSRFLQKNNWSFDTKKPIKITDFENMEYEEDWKFEEELRKLIPPMKIWVSEIKKLYYVRARKISFDKYKKITENYKKTTMKHATQKNAINHLVFPEMEDHFADCIEKQDTGLLRASPMLKLSILRFHGIDMPLINNKVLEANQTIRESLYYFHKIPKN